MPRSAFLWSLIVVLLVTVITTLMATPFACELRVIRY